MARGKVKVNLVLATFSLELVFFCTFHHMIFILSKHKFIILSLSFLRLFSLQVSQNYFLAAAGSTLTDKYCSQIILGGFNLITSLLLKTLSSHCVWQPHSKDHSGQLFTMVVVQHHSQPLWFTNIAGDSQKQGIPWTRAPALFPQMTSRGSVLVSAGRPSTVVPTPPVSSNQAVWFTFCPLLRNPN